MGAIATGGVVVLEERVIRSLRVDPREIERVIATEMRELERREAAYRGGREPRQMQGKTVILVDDGLATGSTMRAAARAVRRQDPERIVVAVPLAAMETCEEFREDVDEIICLVTPRPFGAVGVWYEDLSPTSDEQVHELLERAAAQAVAAR
jgi:predicted phosphoribosyltransferase